jgi:hypothetical protein
MDGSNIHYIIYLCRNTQYKCRILLDNIYHFRGPLTNKIKNVKLRRFGEGKYPICLRRVIIYSVLFIYSDLKYHTQRSRESMRAILIDSISIFGQVFLFFLYFFRFFTLVFRMKKTEAEDKRIISSLTFCWKDNDASTRIWMRSTFSFLPLPFTYWSIFTYESSRLGWRVGFGEI